MFKWIRSELHNHSTHSDGTQTPQELVNVFKPQNVKILALTDHNSVTGQYEFIEECKKHNIIPVVGNEVTTFWGHVLGLGVHEFIDWRKYNPLNPDKICDDIKILGGIAGLAHPFRLGYPISPGCNWMFKVKDFTCFDYLEIMNTSSPKRCLNNVAIDFWLELMRKGVFLSGIAGKDWHGRPNDISDFATYLGFEKQEEELVLADILKAIKKHHAIITRIGEIRISLNSLHETATLGETLKTDNLPITLKIEFETTEIVGKNLVISLDDANGLYSQINVTGEKSLLISDLSPSKYVVIQIFENSNKHDNVLALSNPIFLR